MKRLVPRVETLKIGPSSDSSADYGPLVTQQALERVRNYVEIGIKEGATLVVDGRSFKMQGYENGFYMGVASSTMSRRTCAFTRRRFSGLFSPCRKIRRGLGALQRP